MLKWLGLDNVKPVKYKCFFCQCLVHSNRGYQTDNPNIKICICPGCSAPTYFMLENQIPATAFGDKIKYVPEEIGKLYDEARNCVGANAFTSAVLACRKILMHIAVEKGAEEGKGFAFYVDYLARENYIPRDGEHWVKYIKDKGNEANHVIAIMEKKDAEDLIVFLGGLLRNIWEYPGMLPKADSGD